MAHINKLGDVSHGKRYEVRWSSYDANGKRRFQKERFRTEEQAKAKKRQVEQGIADGDLPDSAGGRKPLRYWAERWYASKSKRIRPNTAYAYRSILDSSVLPAFGDKRIRSLTAADIQEWVESLPHTPPTIRHHHAVLRAILKHAARDNAIRHNAAENVELPTDRSTGRQRTTPRFLTPEEIGRLSSALKDSWPYDLMVVFTAYTGLRASEVAGLNVGDVDLLRRRVTVKRTRSPLNGEHLPKNGKRRSVRLAAWLADDMQAYLSRHPNAQDADAPLFPGRRYDPQPGGQRGAMDWSKPYNHQLFYRRMWKPATKAAGLDPLRFHDLRHTFASLRASVGAKPHEVAEEMGHGDANITLAIYTHVWPDASDAYADLHERPPVPTHRETADLDRRRNRRAG
jgi:integrase